jgi:uncharacterized damage-inducible protein DinB
MHNILDFYEYNSDVRKKYLNAIAKIPWEDIIKDRGASFPSIRDVFLHTLSAYRYWFQYGIKDDMKNFRRVDPESFKNIDNLRTYEHEVDSMVMNLVRNLREEDLDKEYVIHFDDETWHGTMETILMHMIEEELQHRGEINCMFWQQDIDPPVTGYDDWAPQRRGVKAND